MNLMTMTINFNGKNYPVRHIDGHIVSVESLENALLNDDCEYVSDKAKEIDEGIYFYVPTKVILYSDKNLSRYLEQNVF